MSRFFNKSHVMLQTLKVTSITFGISVAIYFFISFLLVFLKVDSSNFAFLVSYYNKFNISKTNAYTPESILIVNTNNISENLFRKQVADLIDSICSHEPLCVGVDIAFPHPKDSFTDSLLSDVINKNSKRLVLAQSIDGDFLSQTIIDNKDGNLIYGLTNLPSFAKYQQSYEFNGILYPLFSYKIFSCINETKKEISDKLLINYTSLNFNQKAADFFLKDQAPLLKDNLLRGKIVLIGDTKDSRDMHHVPFLINSCAAERSCS